MNRVYEIEFQVIPHRDHRYETVGDYWYEVNGMKEVIRVSDMNNEDYEFLVHSHELIESHLCRKRGISESKIKEFDEAFEAARTPGNTDEPGDDIRAPYRKEHQYATLIERLLAKELEVDWDEYEKVVNSL